MCNQSVGMSTYIVPDFWNLSINFFIQFTCIPHKKADTNWQGKQLRLMLELFMDRLVLSVGLNTVCTIQLLKFKSC